MAETCRHELCATVSAISKKAECCEIVYLVILLITLWTTTTTTTTTTTFIEIRKKILCTFRFAYHFQTAGSTYV